MLICRGQIYAHTVLLIVNLSPVEAGSLKTLLQREKLHFYLNGDLICVGHLNSADVELAIVTFTLAEAKPYTF